MAKGGRRASIGGALVDRVGRSRSAVEAAGREIATELAECVVLSLIVHAGAPDEHPSTVRDTDDVRYDASRAGIACGRVGKAVRLVEKRKEKTEGTAQPAAGEQAALAASAS